MPQRFAARPPSGGPGGGGSRRQARRILAYGDSLTAGYHAKGRRFSPYGAALAEALRAEAGGEAEAEVWVCGLSGLKAVRMVERLPARKLRDGIGRVGKGLQALIAEDGPFDLALIMAGTNDLPARGSTAVAVANSVQALHLACHEQGLRTVALSVPPNEGCPSDRVTGSGSRRYEARWTSTNVLLQEWAAQGAQEDGAGVALFVDTEGLVPYVEGSDLWEQDGLHLSPLGSRKLGEGLAPLLAPLLLARPAVAGAAAEVRRPVRRRDLPMPERVPPPPPPPGSAAAAAAAQRRLLAYGDSLTAGFHAFGHLFAPYAEALAPALLPAVSAEVLLCGLSGLTADEMVCGLDEGSLLDCLDRRGQGLRRILVNDGPFDAALIMAGTNDLADEPEAAEVAQNLCLLHRACHAAGVPTVALSVPPSRVSQKEAPLARLRREVNSLLKQWAEGKGAHRPGRGKNGGTGVLLYVDTERLLPYDRESGLWEVDGLHFSRAGSRHLGERLAPLLRPLLLEGALAGSRPSGQPASDLHADSADDMV